MRMIHINYDSQTYTGIIDSPEPNQILVFGSNKNGYHGAGTAKLAKNKWNAIYGQAKGLQGQSYAIITKDLKSVTQPSIPQLVIIQQIQQLYRFAVKNKDKQFIVAYTAKGYNLNGYTSKHLAKMFGHFIIPRNVFFETGFYELMYNEIF